MRADEPFRLALYAGSEHPCPYLPGRQSTLHYVDPQITLTPSLYGALLANGFRRSGGFVYRPGCHGCGRCIAARLPVDGFTPNRSQRRTIARNADLRVRTGPAQLTDAHYELYRSYLNARHHDGGMADASREECETFLIADWCESLFVDLCLDDRLVATAVTDSVPHGLSAIYTFFDPSMPSRSLGTFALLTQLSVARQQGLHHLYLGYWVAESEKMAYKERFRPLQIHVDGRWETCPPKTPLPIPP
jgi:arginine-tRNA-protein transferase